jgi:hypothetical protein
MAIHSVPPLNSGQRHLLTHFKQSLRCGSSRFALGITGLKTRLALPFYHQLTTHDELQQRQDPQRDRSPPNQTRGGVVKVDIHRRERQRATLEATPTSLHQIVAPVGPHRLLKGERLGRLMGAVDPPA